MSGSAKFHLFISMMLQPRSRDVLDLCYTYGIFRELHWPVSFYMLTRCLRALVDHRLRAGCQENQLCVGGLRLTAYYFPTFLQGEERGCRLSWSPRSNYFICTFNLSTEKAEEGRSPPWVQGQPWLVSEFEGSQDYTVKPCQKNKSRHWIQPVRWISR